MSVTTHKQSKWTREPMRDGSGCQMIVPTDGSGTRIVRFLSRHSWANDPNDDRARQDQDRIVLISGATLPEWAIAWLESANAIACSRARANLRAAIADADNFGDSW